MTSREPSLPDSVRKSSSLNEPWLWLITVIVMAVVGLLLFVFDPAKHGFYPRCTFHAATGLSCPGCGGLRAVHQLLHGHLKAALELNAMVVLLAPVCLWFGLREVVFWLTGRRWRNPFGHRAWAWIFMGVILAFGVIRNLPVAKAMGMAQ